MNPPQSGHRDHQEDGEDYNDSSNATPPDSLRKPHALNTQVRNLIRKRMRVQPLGQLTSEEISHDSPPSASATLSFARALAVWVFTAPTEQPMTSAVSDTLRSA